MRLHFRYHQRMAADVTSLPSVDQVLNLESMAQMLDGRDRTYVVTHIRKAIEQLRNQLLAGEGPRSHLSSVDACEDDRTALMTLIVSTVEAALVAGESASLRRVINATGVILHTGLGRAPLAAAALEAIQATAAQYCNLELDLESGLRGSRVSHVEALLAGLSGAEAVAVANNNAGAVMLMLNTLARDREVVVSRGQLVEIGGSFRIPDIIGASGARIREVGTTNRTHRSDYERAIGPQTALILAVHPSNYEVRGFTAEVALEELVDVARTAQLPLAFDLGAGALLGLERWGLPHEPVVSDCLQLGVDVVSFSADKILGGPQAGIIAGGRELISRMAANPMMRALRCDKLIIAALEATLRLFQLDPEALRSALPALRMMTEPVDIIETRAAALLRALDEEVRLALGASVRATSARIGSGSLPVEELPSFALACKPEVGTVEAIARDLRQLSQPVVGRISHDQLILDMRTVRDDEVSAMVSALSSVAGAYRSPGGGS